MKVEIQKYHKSIYNSGLTKDQETVIWDFYVTHSFASSANQKRKISDYGLKSIPWDKMKAVANLEPENVRVLLANSINKTLKENGLEVVSGKGEDKHNCPIEIDLPKIVCLTPYTISDFDAPKGKCGEAESVLTHIRNSLAHGLTYFFDNGNVLFEDKTQSGIITARIILRLQTLLDWVKVIDINETYYILHNGKTNAGDMCVNCEVKEKL